MIIVIEVTFHFSCVLLKVNYIGLWIAAMPKVIRINIIQFKFTANTQMHAKSKWKKEMTLMQVEYGKLQIISLVSGFFHRPRSFIHSFIHTNPIINRFVLSCCRFYFSIFFFFFGAVWMFYGVLYFKCHTFRPVLCFKKVIT